MTSRTTDIEKRLNAFSEASFRRAVSRLRREDGFLGTGTGAELMTNALRWRRFYRPSSFYGHRLAAGVSIVSDYEGLVDLFTTDSRGVCKNAVGGDESPDRIRRAREDGHLVIAFLGGSTVQGVGARLPDFTIPALVEDVLREEHGIRATCLNHGVAGWSSAEQLHFLIHEIDYRPDVCVFYDGWNCCWNYYYGFLLNSAGTDRPSGSWTRGSSLRHCEQDELNGIAFRPWSLVGRAFSLAANGLLSGLAAAVPSARWRKLLDRWAAATCSLRPPDVLRHANGVVVSDERRNELLRDAVAEYLRIDALAAAYCAARGVRFLHYFQPLLATTRKPLTGNESARRSGGRRMRNPEIFALFAERLRSSDGGERPLDLTDALDAVEDEVFVDGGHLNRYGNYHVARRIARDLVGPGALTPATPPGRPRP